MPTLPMNSNTTYTSKKVLKKTLFNIGFQVFPIATALFLTPFLIEEMGKDAWAKYSTGISLIFLSNYFSFGIGPTLNRRVSEIVGRKDNQAIRNEVEEGISFSYVLGIGFFVLLQIALFFVFESKRFSIVQTSADYTFYALLLCVFLLAFFIIPFRSLLESFSDFYFLAMARAITAAMLFLVPAGIIYFSETSLINIAWVLLVLYSGLYIVYYNRSKSHQKTMLFTMAHPLERPVLKRTFTFDTAFLNETFWFSIFFVSTAIVLFFDRFYYPIFFDTRIISDQVTLLDLFNRVAIITGTISLVYFSAISVWYQEKNLERIRKNLRFQLVLVGFAFTFLAIFCKFWLGPILEWWLGPSYSGFILENAYPLLIGALLINFTILLIRPLQAIGQIRQVSIWLILSTTIYLIIVVFLGIYKAISYHYLAFVIKAVLDLAYLSFLLKRNKIL
jgi:O-antigen/teichoic acid export membrane protein